jgi:hypothetical protein
MTDEAIFTRNRAKPPKWLDEAQVKLDEAMQGYVAGRVDVAWHAVDALASTPREHVRIHRIALIEMFEHIARMLEETR